MTSPFPNYDMHRRFAMPRRIAVATDLNDADVLLPYAIAQARVTGAHLSLIHALAPRVAMNTSCSHGCDHQRSHESVSIDRLEDMQRRAHLQGVCCSIRWGHGNPSKVILNALHQCNADRLIAGSHGRRRLGEILHGSVTKELMAAVTVPTLFVGPRVHAPAGPEIRNILCLLALQDGFEKLARFALLVGQVYQARVTLMHVLDDRDVLNKTGAEEWARNALQRVVAQCGRREKAIAIEVRHGNLIEVACSSAEELHSDVLVLGTRSPAHTTYLHDLLAYQVVATVGCPVYCYRLDLPEPQPRKASPDTVAACNV